MCRSQMPSDSEPDDARGPPLPKLSAEQRMLLDMRDTLYDGSWDDFVADLTARLHGVPHVFDVVPDSPQFAKTIRSHLVLIDELKAWEQAHHTTLHAE